MNELAAGGWPEGYPAPTLRAETRAMAEAWVEVLRAWLPEGMLRAVHFKGSALKRWDTPIDYVPGLSDVDIHVSLASDADEARLDSMGAALEVNALVLEAYTRRMPGALHVPKPQFVVSNRLDQDPGILPSPGNTVETLYGEAYPARAITEEEQAVSRARDRELLEVNAAFLGPLPLRAIDRLGGHVSGLLGELNWRVSPVAPRVLELLGVPYGEAWSLNRTELVAALRERERGELADAYERYYLAGWRRFLEGDAGSAGLEVLRQGAEVVRLGAAFAAALPAAHA
jgi:hypothetical protein